MSRWRGRLKQFVLLPLVVVAVGILAYFTFRTTLQVDTLRQQSVLEATVGLATEKANRVDRQIVDQDNVVMAIADPARLEMLTERWLPTAQRETPSVRAILILDASHTVLAFASRATGALAEEESFRRLLVDRMLVDMELDVQALDELRHLHRDYLAQSYLLSYWQRVYEGRRYIVIAWHDMGRIVRATFPMLYAELTVSALGLHEARHSQASAASRVNVVDEEGRIIYGPPLRSGEFTVGVRFPTTLYNWRVQVSPLASEELAARVRNRRLLEIIMVSLSCIVIVVGAIAIVLVAEKERKVSALKSEFVANVSHELKTPLALVRMFAEMLQTGRVASDDKRKEYLDIIVRESERLSALIENVLDFARLERGRGSYEFADGDVGESVTTAVSACRYRAEREGVRLDVTVDATLPRACIDDRAIQLAVINLIDNALKYAPDSEVISVVASSQNDGVRVDVRDQGHGIAAENRHRIFERFVRVRRAHEEPAATPAPHAEPAAARRPESPVRGSGIGLALVKHIAESHGGRAWVESEIGAGSTFSFTIPAYSVRHAAAKTRTNRRKSETSDDPPQRVS